MERERNRQLSDRLDSLEKGGMVGQVVAEEQVPVVKEGNEEGEVGQHTTSPEFAYMAGLVKELHHVLHAPPKPLLRPTNILTSPLAPTQTSSKLQLGCITTSPSTSELATNHPCQLAVNPARQLPRYLSDFADVTLAYADG